MQIEKDILENCPEDPEGYVYNRLLFDGGEVGADYYGMSVAEFKTACLRALGHYYIDEGIGHIYKVTLSAQGITFIVAADNAGDAIDYVIDHCEENAPGLVTDEEPEYPDDYIYGGNHGLWLTTYNVRTEKLN